MVLSAVIRNPRKAVMKSSKSRSPTCMNSCGREMEMLF